LNGSQKEDSVRGKITRDIELTNSRRSLWKYSTSHLVFVNAIFGKGTHECAPPKYEESPQIGGAIGHCDETGFAEAELVSGLSDACEIGKISNGRSFDVLSVMAGPRVQFVFTEDLTKFFEQDKDLKWLNQ
jgi:hypothetical protein